MQSFFRFLLRRPWTCLAIGVVLSALGWPVAKNLEREVFPEVQVPRVTIQAECPGLSPEDVERRVTMPVEAAMASIPGVRCVRASSGQGLAFVWIDFDWDANPDTARFAVFERLARVRGELPAEVECEIAPAVSISGEIALIALTASATGGVDRLTLRETGEYELRRRLLAIPGIGEVTVMGGLLPEWRIEYEPQRLAAAGVGFDRLAAAVAGSRTERPAGYLADAHGLEIPLVQNARADSRAALEQCSVATAGGAALTLGEVAGVRRAGSPRRGSASRDGVDAVLLSVQKTPGGDTCALQRAIDAELDSFALTPAARGIDIRRDSYRPADFIATSLAGTGSVLFNAALVVIAVLVVILARPGAIATVLAVAAMAALVALGLFPLFGLTLNVMTLGGLAVAAGDIVDAAIIFTEAIWRRLDENDGRLERSAVIAAAANSVLPGVLFSTLTIALVFTPVLFLTGIESRFFGPFALAYLIIFAASFVAAAVFAPVFAKLVWRGRRRRKNSPSRPPVLRLLLALYRPALAFAVRHPLPTLAVAAVAGALALHLAAGFGASFLPAMREDVYNVIFALAPDTSLAESERVAETAARRVRTIDGVKSVTRRTGRAERDQHAEGVASSEFIVRLESGADADRVRSAIRSTLKAFPGAAVAVGYPIAHRIDAVLSGVDAEIAIDVYHETPERLREAVRRLLPLVESLPGATDVRADKEIPVTLWRIDYDARALAALGMTMAGAGEQVAAALAGETLGEVREGYRRSAVVLRHARAESFDARALATLDLVAPDGSLVPLKDVAHVYPEISEALRLRENGRRKATIACNVAPGGNSGDLVAALRKRLAEPAAELGCSLAFGGSHVSRTAAGRRLALLGAALCLVVALILRAALGEWRAAAIAFANVPFALAGGVFAVALAGGVVSVPSLVGFVTVAGFTLRNGILLVHRYRERLAAGETVADAIRGGSEERMASILMTTLTTVVGLLPIVTAGGRTGGEVLAPLGIVQFGGILGATALSLVVIPALAALAFGRTPRRAAAKAALAVAALAPLSGCIAVEPKPPVDWRQVAAAWQNAVRRVELADCHDAEQLVLAGNPVLVRRRLAAAGAERADELADLWDDPEVSADLLRIVQGGANPWLGGIGLSAALPLSGSRRLAARAARLYTRAERESIAADERETRLAAARAWHRLAAARDRLDAIAEFFADRRVRRERAAVEGLLAAGEIEPSAAASVRRRCHQLEHQRMAAKAAQDEAAAELRALANLHPDCAIDLGRRACTYHAASLHDTTAADFAGHPRVRAELARLEADEAALAAEIRRQYPDLRIGPAYSNEEGNDRLGLALAIDLPLWNRNRRNIATAESTRDVQYAAALDAWRDIVRGAARAAARRRRILDHPAPPPRLTAAADALNDAGELPSVEFLAERAEALDERLAEIDWHHDALDADAECSYYQPERN